MIVSDLALVAIKVAGAKSPDCRKGSNYGSALAKKTHNNS
jgi:hypothetical protein